MLRINLKYACFKWYFILHYTVSEMMYTNKLMKEQFQIYDMWYNMYKIFLYRYQYKYLVT